MVKKTLLGGTVSHLIKELSPEIPEGAEEEVENDVVEKLKKVLGNNWAALPVTGPYMMLVVLILNYKLLPMGVTPVTVADKALSKSREYGLDTKFSNLLLSAKASANSTGEFTSDKLEELTEYSAEQKEKVAPILKELLDNTQKLGKSVVDKGKSLSRGVFGSIKDKLDREDKPEESEE